MAVSVFSAAKFLAEKSGWSLTNLQIQKILYLAQMAYMAENKGERLINSYFEAWDYGPVCPPLYRRLRMFGSDYVTNIAFSESEALEKGSPAEKGLEEAFKAFGGLSGGRLVTLTHQKGGAWEKRYQEGEYGAAISDQDILDEYQNVFSGKINNDREAAAQ